MATTDMPAGGSPGNITNPTLEQFETLLAASAAASEPYFDFDDRPAEQEECAQRMRAANDVLRAVRPTDPIVMAAWLRWALSNYAVDSGYESGFAHIADALEAPAGGAGA